MNNSKAKKNEKKDEIRLRVESIYRNYGIDPDDMEEEEIARVTNYYINGKADLDSDYIKSLKHKEKVDDIGGNLNND